MMNPQNNEHVLFIANTVYELMMRRNVLLNADADQVALYAVPLSDSVLIIVDPVAIGNVRRATAEPFVEHLQDVLKGRRVLALHLETGIFYRISYTPQAQRQELSSRVLDLNQQPNPLAVPIGATYRKDLWLTFGNDMDSVLIGGSRRMGKTNLLHGWIAALIRGKKSFITLFDGKKGAEFARYANTGMLDDQVQVSVIEGDFTPALRDLTDEMNGRLDDLKLMGAVNLDEYNARVQNGVLRMRRRVLIVDELAFALREPGVEAMLVDLIARGGAVGIHPVLATQRPSSDVVTPQLKGNLTTRIALPVPDRASSMVILDQSGAEKITKVPGRLLITHNARIIDAHAFRVDLAEFAPKRLPSARTLDDRENCIAKAAIEQGGEFDIDKIAEAVNERTEDINGLAREWQARGWLTPVGRSNKGNRPRRVTEALRNLVQNGKLAECGNLRNVAECA